MSFDQPLKKLYFIMIRFDDDVSPMARARESAPKVLSILKKISDDEHQLVFTARDGTTFGYFVKTTAPLRVVRAELFGTSKTSRGGCALRNNDSYIAFELGPQFDGVGFSRAWTWLQHHH